MHWNGFSACITIDGRVADEFATTVSPDKKRVTCWIASEVGKNFIVHWKNDTYRDFDTSGYLTMDGNECGGAVLSRHPVANATQRAGISDGVTIRPFKFGDLVLSDDDTVLSSQSSDIGTIVLSISPVAYFQESAYVPAESLPQTTAHTTATKLSGTHRVELGEVQQLPQYKPRVVVWPAGPEIVSFCFIYRPIDVLRSMGVIGGRKHTKPPTHSQNVALRAHMPRPMSSILHPQPLPPLPPLQSQSQSQQYPPSRLHPQPRLGLVGPGMPVHAPVPISAAVPLLSHPPSQSQSQSQSHPHQHPHSQLYQSHSQFVQSQSQFVQSQSQFYDPRLAYAYAQAREYAPAAAFQSMAASGPASQSQSQSHLQQPHPQPHPHPHSYSHSQQSESQSQNRIQPNDAPAKTRMQPKRKAASHDRDMESYPTEQGPGPDDEDEAFASNRAGATRAAAGGGAEQEHRPVLEDGGEDSKDDDNDSEMADVEKMNVLRETLNRLEAKVAASKQSKNHPNKKQKFAHHGEDAENDDPQADTPEALVVSVKSEPESQSAIPGDHTNPDETTTT
ncbi:TKL/TKL-ccin protein kinase [Mycena chlorophos]|uniref:TKL/TKL-ccin protein kinase n=1 Tax=Mycena chlorophos TaxID=658473 RepID=A0A8H6W8R7_MYCCL|nr:TKL/TKL-ccin protein kinase [Mycena chlorophos]